MKKALLTRIEDEFFRMKMRNPSYSLRAFAKKLDVKPSALSEIMNGKRPPTLRFGEQVVRALKLSPEEKNVLLKSLFKKNTPSRVSALQAEAEYTQLEQNQYDVISRWFYFAILSLTETRDFKSDPAWIANRLGISERETAAALGKLNEIGLLEKRHGKWKATGLQLSTTSGVYNPAIRSAHFQNLNLIEKSLSEVPLEEQDFSAMTLATSRKKMKEAKARILAFRRELSAFLESGPKEEVYRLSIFFTPLTKTHTNKESI